MTHTTINCRHRHGFLTKSWVHPQLLCLAPRIVQDRYAGCPPNLCYRQPRKLGGRRAWFTNQHNDLFHQIDTYFADSYLHSRNKHHTHAHVSSASVSAASNLRQCILLESIPVGTTIIFVSRRFGAIMRRVDRGPSIICNGWTVSRQSPPLAISWHSKEATRAPGSITVTSTTDVVRCALRWRAELKSRGTACSDEWLSVQQSSSSSSSRGVTSRLQA